MEFKGTKGKWISGKDGNILSKLVIDRIKNHKDTIVKSDTGEIAQCWADFHDGTIIPEEECRANALLISKAPEMLEMLKKARKALLMLDSLSDEIEQLIKEATEL